LKTRLIANPRSGGASRALGPARKFAAAAGAEVRLTARAGHAGELAREALADGCELVVAVGGDGTINEVAATLVGTGAVLGIVPGGSGNGLGRALGLGLSAVRALEILKQGRPRWIDMGLADGRPFFNLAGLGFEAEIAARFNRSSHRGLTGYLRVAAGSLDLLRASRFTITTETCRRQMAALTLTVANGQQFGGHALIAPRARLDDGRLDLTAVPPPTVWNALPLVLALFRGTLAKRRGVVMTTGARFIVERPWPGPLHTDGEVHPAGTRIVFEVRPASLRVMAPAG
jgi:YegS/Rv2252/BmrU family lipid kinase